MKYEITSCQGDRYNITGSDDRGTYIFYRGTYDAEKDVWKLVPKPGTPAAYENVLFLPVYMVQWAKPVQTKAVPEKKTKTVDKPKAWRTLDDPPGQIPLL